MPERNTATKERILAAAADGLLPPVDMPDRRAAPERPRCPRPLRGAWEVRLQDGARSGVFVEQTPVLVKGILGLFNYSHLWFRSSGPMPYETVADTFVDLVLYGIAGISAERTAR